MPIVVEAKSEADYNTWIEAKKAEAAAGAAGADKEWTKEDLLANGKTVYEKNCAVCHMASGAGLPPNFPALTGSKIATGAIWGADGRYLKDSHVDRLLNGKGVMPPWKAQMNDVDIASVITYERQGLGNAATVDPIVQPAQVKAAR
jgi:cytochrome c oxidase subunit 2